MPGRASVIRWSTSEASVIYMKSGKRWSNFDGPMVARPRLILPMITSAPRNLALSR